MPSEDDGLPFGLPLDFEVLNLMDIRGALGGASAGASIVWSAAWATGWEGSRCRERCDAGQALKSQEAMDEVEVRWHSWLVWRGKGHRARRWYQMQNFNSWRQEAATLARVRPPGWPSIYRAVNQGPEP